MSPHCIYDKEEIKTENEEKKIKSSTKMTFYHKAFALFTILYLTEQAILPFSHSITKVFSLSKHLALHELFFLINYKGYNNWTNGLYGYSWDMMVHSWHTQHIKISFYDKNTNKTHYLNPKAWTSSKRWSSHGDMMHQYAKCIKNKLNS